MRSTTLMIKKMFNPGSYSKNIDLSLLTLRIAGGALMLTHGIGKMESLFGSDPIQFPDPIGLGATTSLALAVFAEVLCALFLIIGFATRFSAFNLLITMLVAVFAIHIADPFAKQELPLLYASIYLVVLITGAGKYSIDSIIFNKK